MFETLLQLDSDILLAVNGQHCEFFDYFMRACSQKFIWIPFYAAIFILLCYRYSLKFTILALLFITLTITLSDQISAAVLRPLIGRLRPANLDNPLSQWVHIVGSYRSGRYGFPSSHAANSSALTFFCIFTFRQRLLSWLMTCWMLLVCYSRMYLGVHYLGDLMAGFLLGFVIAVLVYQAFMAMTRRLDISTEPRERKNHHLVNLLPPTTCLLVLLWIAVAAAIQTWT